VTRSSAPPTLLVTGGTGQIGYELVRELAPLGRVVAPPRAELDIAHPDAVRSYVRALRPDVIVNAAAYTAVDDAETEGDVCHRVNAAAPGVLAEEAVSLGAVLVHYSTDYVFDGAKDVPYAEDDEPGPLQAYGRSKLLGERGVQSAGGSYVILRTSWVYGARGRNFLRTMLRLAREPRALRVVDDQVGTPTWCRLVASVTAQLLAPERGGRLGARIREAPGVYHLTGAGQCSWAEFAEAELSLDGAPDEHRSGGVRRVSSAEYGARATRPRNSVLDNGKVRDQIGVVMPHWRAQLQLALER
jgi:dTDP-4-dehydrorhamnose reductase